MKLSEAVNKVIELAQKVVEYYEREMPRYHPNYPLVNPDDKEPPPPPEQKELRDFLVSLPGDMIYQVLALMFFSHGTMSTAELAETCEEWKSYCASPERTADFLSRRASLADHLQYALEELGQQKLSVDRLPWKRGKVRKP